MGPFVFNPGIPSDLQILGSASLHMDTGLRATLLNHCAWHLRVHPLSTTLLVSWELPFETQFSLLPPPSVPQTLPSPHHVHVPALHIPLVLCGPQDSEQLHTGHPRPLVE